MKLYIAVLPFVITIIFMQCIFPVQGLQRGNEYSPEEQDKIIGIKHFEDFLRDLEKKIADWTKAFRDTVVMEKPNPRTRRQVDADNPPQRLPIKNWIVVQDMVEGVKYLRKQISDFIDRASRFITGDQILMRQSGQSPNGPYVPLVKELREYLILLQTRLTVWSKAINKVFQRQPDGPMLAAQ